MKLTVAIPTYNKEKCIDRCIQSVLAEKKYISKILVIDNNSVDKTFELAKKYEPQITCIRNQANLGMGKNWNKCIDLCKTDLLMIFHADDELLPNTIKSYLDFFDKYLNVAFIHANCYYVKDSKNIIRRQYVETDNKEIRRVGIEALSMPGNACSTVIVKKSVYDDLGYFIESSMSPDIEMWKRIASKYDIGHLNFPTVIVHLDHSSAGHQSLINREVQGIQKDWEMLSDKIISYYPPAMRDVLKREARKHYVDGFIMVATANMRAKQYKRVMQTLYLIFFHYKGLKRVIYRAYHYFKDALLRKRDIILKKDEK